MSTEQEVRRFLEEWTDSWKSSSHRSKILHPGGGIQYPGEESRYDPDTEGKRTDAVRQIAPDLRMRLLRWAETGGVLFGEWELSCTIGGRSLKFVGVNRFDLEGDRAREGRAFIDRLELLEFAEPDREVLTLGDLMAAALRPRE